MIELLLLIKIFENYKPDMYKVFDEKYNLKEMNQRLKQLLEEFLESYIIESNSKE